MTIILSEIRPGGADATEQTYDRSVLRVGRDPFECDIAFGRDLYPMVSRKHAELRSDEGKWFVTDLNSRYGTFVNGERVAGTQRIWAGNTIQFGQDGPLLKVVWFETFRDSVAPATSAKIDDPESMLTNIRPVPPEAKPGPEPSRPASSNEPESMMTSIRPVLPEPNTRPEPKTTPPVPQAALPVLQTALPVPTSWPDQAAVSQGGRSDPGAIASDARLIFIDEPARGSISLSQQGVAFGRDPACDVAFERSQVMVSRKHAMVRREGNAFILEDNGSFNGTYINDQRISSPTPLYHNDVVRLGIGGPLLRFDSPSRPAPADAAALGNRSLPPSIPDGTIQNAEAVKPKTMVLKLDKSPSTHAAQSNEPHLQLLMSLTFAGKKELTIGRDNRNDITLDGLQISSRHARLLNTNGSIFVDDLGSTNGVYVNGVRVSRQQISPADKVQIGLFEIRIDAAGNIGVFDTRSKTRVDAVNLVKEVRSGGQRLRLLDGVSLSIQPNEFVGILGPSGAGKSTLIDALNGMRPASGGNVLINNLDLYRHLESLKAAIGYVPQDDIIHRELTVYRTLYYVAKLRLSRDVSRAEIDQTINEVLDVTGLADRRDVTVSQLSGGQRKRVSIAVELITKPSVIFLDEPTSGLDPGTEEKIMRLFRQIAESGRTVILTTHAMENVSLFDKIIVLMRGKLVYYGTPQGALKQLGAANYKQLFDRLEDPVEQAVLANGEGVRRQVQEATAESWKQKFAKTQEFRENVYEPLKQLGKLPPSGPIKRNSLGLIGSFVQWITLSQRYLEVLFKDKLNLFILFAQAPVIALITFFIMDAQKPRDFAYFVLAIVAVWFGTSVAAREIIREQPVYRRERMVNLGLFPYLGSKLFVLGLIVAVQCAMLFIPLKLLDLVKLMPMPGDGFGIPQLFAMLLTAGVGISIGLFISALVKTSEMATSLVPLVLIPQILFSGIVGVPSGISKPLSLLAPAAWSFDTMKRFSTLDTLEKEGAEPNDKTGGLGLYKQIETDNDKIIADARKSEDDYKSKIQKQMHDYGTARDEGMSPPIPKPDDMPAIQNPHKMPKDLSGYVTFLHPWMNEILNQFVLMLMFGVLVLGTLIILRLQDIR